MRTVAAPIAASVFNIVNMSSHATRFARRQPVAFSLIAGATVSSAVDGPHVMSVGVKNRYSFKDLEHLDLQWSVTSDCGTLASGSLPNLGALEPQFSLTVKECGVAALAGMASVPGRAWLNLSACLRGEEAWGPKGHVVARQQFELKLEVRRPQGTKRRRLRQVQGAKTTNTVLTS